MSALSSAPAPWRGGTRVATVRFVASPENPRAPEEAQAAGRRTMSLEVFGQRINVVSDAHEDRVREVVDFVNRRLEAIRDGTRRVQTDQIALLAALNLAEELFEERARSERLRRKVRERSRKLLSSIDAVSKDLDARMTGEDGGHARQEQSSSSLPGA